MNARRFGYLLFGILAFAAAQAQTQTATAATTTPPSDQTKGQAKDDTVKLEKYVVTGSNIPIASDALAAPVTVLGPVQLANSGVSTNALDILRKTMPMFSGNGNLGGENATILSNSTFGGSMVALHNLSTLVLINGRRVAFDPAEGEGGYEFVDMNMIPVAAIKRIEVLSDGASAIYGSDAVGGVVNVILNSDYNGWEAGYHFGESPNQGHYKERSGYIIGGTGNGKTSITISGEFSEQDPIYMNTRPYTNPIYGTSYYPGIIDVYNLATNVDQRYKLNTALNAPPGGGTYTIDQLVANGVYTPVTSSQVTKGFNLANYQTLAQSSRRKSVVLDFNHKIFDESLQAFGDVIFSNVNTESSLNGQPIPLYVSTPYIDVVNTGATPAPPGNALIPSTSSVNPFSATWLNQGSPNDQSAGYIVTVHDRNPTYPRLSQSDSTLMRVVGGLKGDINENYHWEAAANINRYGLDFTNPGVVSTANFNAAAATGAINPFAYNQAPGVLPGSIIGTAFVNMVSTLNSVDFKLTGTPFDLPAGKLGFAIGASYTREALTASPDVNSIPDANGNIGWLYGVSMEPFNAHRKVSAFYAEIEAPIVAPAQKVPGVYSLNLDVAGRVEDYTVVGSSKVPKFSVKYEPLDDDFALRSTVGKSFAAPILYDLFGPLTTGSSQSLSFNNYSNAGVATGAQTQLVQFNVESGSNPKLQPSTATTWTAGMVYTPKQVKGLSVSFDYFHTKQTNLIGSYDQTTVVQSLEQYGPNSPYASTVHFGSYAGHGVTSPGQISTANPSSVYLNLPLINIASQELAGWDATAEYAFDTASAGKFDIATTLSGYQYYKAKALPTDPYFNFVGDATNYGATSQGTIPRWRSYTTVTWNYKAYGVVLAHTYIPGVTDVGPGGTAATTPVAVASYQQVDAILSLDFKQLDLNKWLDNLSVRVGMNNIFNKMPPEAVNAFSNTNADVSTYDGPIGRMYFVDLTYKF